MNVLIYIYIFLEKIPTIHILKKRNITNNTKNPLCKNTSIKPDLQIDFLLNIHSLFIQTSHKILSPLNNSLCLICRKTKQIRHVNRLANLWSKIRKKLWFYRRILQENRKYGLSCPQKQKINK